MSMGEEGFAARPSRLPAGSLSETGVRCMMRM